MKKALITGIAGQDGSYLAELLLAEVASGETHSVREFVEAVFSGLGLDYEKYLKVDPSFFRPAEQVQLCGNPVKAMERLGWHRTKDFRGIVEEMVVAETGLYSALEHKGINIP